MSAGSSTIPGGYGSEPAAGGEQFPVSDDRTPSELAKWLEETGFHVAWSPKSPSPVCGGGVRGGGCSGESKALDHESEPRSVAPTRE